MDCGKHSDNKELFSIDIKGSTIISTGADAIVLKSTNSGNTWATIDYKITSQSDVNSVYMFDANTYFSCGGGGFIRKSNDGGATFTFGINPMLAELNQIYFFDSNHGWAVSRNTNAIIRTTDGGNTWLLPAGTSQNLTWVQKLTSGYIPGNNIYLSPFNKKEIFVISSNHVYRSLDIGETWTNLSTFPNGYVANSFYVSPKDTNIWIISIITNGNFGKVLRSVNYGSIWTETYSGPRSSDGTPITMDPNHTDSLYYAPSDNVLLKSTNFGLNWTSAGPKVFHDVCVMKVLEGNSNIILLGEREGNANLFRTTDFGASWQKVDSTEGISGEIPGLTYSRNDPNTIYCTFFYSSHGIRKSTNQGLTWNTFWADTIGWGIDIAKDDPNLLIYGNGTGTDTHLTTNGGATFIPIISGISPYNQALIGQQY